MSLIHIVNLQTCNIGSVENMLKFLGIKSIVVNGSKDMAGAEKIILPGVGSFDANLKKIHELGLYDVIKELVEIKKIPILGICLGMQLFCKYSEEGEGYGFGFFNAKVVKFKFEQNSKKILIPHMGWNEIEVNKQNKLIRTDYDKHRFYFVHSYHVKCEDISDVMFTTNYGYEFHSGINKENIYGVQFHPEKSHKHGMDLLRNFANI